MSFLFVDSITKWEPAQFISGTKTISPSDIYLFKTHDGHDAFFPSLIGETLGQLAAWNVMAHCNFQKRPVAGIVETAQALNNATIADVIELTATIDSLDETAVVYHGVASVQGKTIFQLNNAIGPLLPMDRFIDENEVRKQFESLFHHNKTIKQSNASSPKISLFYDTITNITPHQTAHAEKYIAQDEPWFSDHFPKNPVLPLTILLEYNLQLSKDFLKASHLPIPHHVTFQQIKMNDFVKPGQTIETQLEVISDNPFCLRFRTTVNGKKVCTAILKMELNTP